MGQINVKVYDGYGHTHNLVVFGHVFGSRPAVQHQFTNRLLVNIIHLLKLFFVQPVPRANLRLHWRGQVMETRSEDDGFFKFEWQSAQEVSAGWHPVTVEYIDENGRSAASGDGMIYVPHSTQYVFISDIDDTVMVSYSATKFRRLKELLTRNPHTRQQFEKVADWYRQLAYAHTAEATPNPFFYVSSSEWNLFDYLQEFFVFNKLPKGIFLLNQVKRWFQLFQTGKTKHAGKILRIVRIIEVFPRQQFVLIGDNSQHDPDIYTTIAAKHPEKIFAIYIRNINADQEAHTRKTLALASDVGIHTCLFKYSDEAAAHGRTIGLIDQF
ncbi:phosphatase domain-containing protein [Paraflavitalea sp. CAU 1676]|uniref:App1 family protein n=1 Tax=Paraflavitalea sp. CAU 1676 TaxID=3032598 RepID=UPI0023D995B7|nr:phosphatase domain-containing protein [Paraflavitalea sp. CAU 1676]MDF2192949.1 DUF2183 domain-containing protein [Paraflavitalea sp. CAU 1676]